jgi:hypothetical protein
MVAMPFDGSVVEYEGNGPSPSGRLSRNVGAGSMVVAVVTGACGMVVAVVTGGVVV